MKHHARGAVVAVACLLLAGCGSTPPAQTALTTTTTTSTVAALKDAPPCLTGGSAASFAMQCATPPAVSEPPTFSAAPGSTYGIDSYGASYAGLPEAFDCSYLSGYPGGKDWDSGSVRDWTGRGKHICVVWETAAARAYAGYSAGRDDAEAALRESREIGLPAYVPLRFAVDTPTYQSSTLPASMLAYFQGAHSILGSRTGAYGSYYVITALENAHLITAATAWQTIGWSYGHRSNACIFQYSINDSLDRYSVDYDVARPGCAAAFYKYTPPAPKLVCFGKGAKNTPTCKTARADVTKWGKEAVANQRVSKRLDCPTNVRELTKLRQREDWFAGKLHRYPHVKTAHRVAALKATRHAVNQERAFVNRRRCGLWSSRQAYSAARVAKVRKEYS